MVAKKTIKLSSPASWDFFSFVTSYCGFAVLWLIIATTALVTRLSHNITPMSCTVQSPNERS